MGAIDKTTGDSTAPAKVPQPHGGAINRGGTRGNKGGRPPSKLRAICRKMAGPRLPILGKIAKDETESAADRIRAIDTLMKYGLDRAISVADLRECLRQQSEIAYEYLPKEQADELLARFRPVWSRL
jgi:hypothetical protein